MSIGIDEQHPTRLAPAIVFLLDNSNSMIMLNLMEEAKQALSDLLTELRNRSPTALAAAITHYKISATGTTKVDTIMPLTPVKDLKFLSIEVPDQPQTEREVAEAYKEALLESITILHGANSQGTQRMVLMLGDGGTESDNLEEVCQTLKNNGIPAHSVKFGGNTPVGPMSRISESTGGKVVKYNSAVATFDTIFQTS